MTDGIVRIVIADAARGHGINGVARNGATGTWRFLIAGCRAVTRLGGVGSTLRHCWKGALDEGADAGDQ
jgi:hypothetical protein